RDLTVTGVQTCALPIFVGFEEVIMRTHLDRPVAGIGDDEHDARAPLIQDQLTISHENLARYHLFTVSVRARSPASPRRGKWLPRSEERRVGKECGSRRW